MFIIFLGLVLSGGCCTLELNLLVTVAHNIWNLIFRRKCRVRPMWHFRNVMPWIVPRNFILRYFHDHFSQAPSIPLGPSWNFWKFAEIFPLKGPKREIFDSGFFALIRPIWIGDLGTRPKNYKFWCLGLKVAILYFLALSPSTLKNCKRCRLLR